MVLLKHSRTRGSFLELKQGVREDAAGIISNAYDNAFYFGLDFTFLVII
ncbi:hypothetical protein [Niallia circulans]|nr:hypothetical protein [Niallia circulans]